MIICQIIGMIVLLMIYYRDTPPYSAAPVSVSFVRSRDVERKAHTTSTRTKSASKIREKNRRHLDFTLYNDLVKKVTGQTTSQIPEEARHTFRFIGDANLCNQYPWKYCYIAGNLRLIRKLLLELGWREVVPETPIAHLTWSLADLQDAKVYAAYHTLTSGLLVNHFPGIFELGNKKYLSKNLKNMYELFGSGVTDFFPVSFQLPKEKTAFEELHEKMVQEKLKNPGGEAIMWVLKDPVGDRGEGVRVISGPQGIPSIARNFIVQQYIGNPYLINGYKFTIRAYGLITSFDPLRLYVFRNGFVHMATDKYDPSPENIGNKYMHLTNPDINKHRPNHPYAQDPRPWYWSLDEYLTHVKKSGGDPEMFFQRLKLMVAKAVLSAAHKFVQKAHDHVQYRGNCFEIFGLDVLVDRDLKPWIVEVNPDPDMSAGKNFPLAEKVKIDMLRQSLNIVGVRSVRNSQEDTRAARKVALSTFLWDISQNSPEPVTINAPFYRNCGRPIRPCPLGSPEEAIILAASELELEAAERAGGGWERAFPFDSTRRELEPFLAEDRAASLLMQRSFRSEAMMRCWERAIVDACAT